MSVSTSGGPAGMGVTVTIAGTSMSTTVDATGHFTFKNVPGGHVVLQFSGGGMNGQVDLPDVGDTETITLTLTVNGASIELEDEHRRGGPEDQLEGKVQSLPPATAAGTFMVAGQLVVTDANTRLFNGGASALFSSLTVGQRVHVSGHLNGTSLLASTIQIQGPNNNSGNNNPVAGTAAQLDGPMGGVKGSCPNLTFGVKGTTVFTGGSTVFTPACSTFKSGDKVTVIGVVLVDGSVSASTVTKQ
ncbi:MAG TPA: DUF5666 domain-containing protein [Vicinamibacterales bacterium]|nr:DUF5666 domain-containing protein [Vicinamibacterales bacterium]